MFNRSVVVGLICLKLKDIPIQNTKENTPGVLISPWDMHV